MANREKGGRVVFIGNIPYGVSEEQIMDIFGRTGTVVGFRLVYDKETGQPKGFGFLEYQDTDSAASAVRNLNDHEIGGRTLRVDYSNDNRGTSNQNNNNNANQQHESNRVPLPPSHFANAGPPPAAPALPPLPPGSDLPPGVTAIDAISRTISAIPTPQLLDFISQLKGLTASNPAQATALLQQAPQLGYAVFQAMMLLGLVDTSIVTQLIDSVPAVAQPPPQAHPQPPPAMQYQPPPQQMGYPPQQYPPQQYNQYAQPPPQQYMQTTPVQQPAYHAPPQQAPQPSVNPIQEDALKAQVMALSQEQINGLPAEARAQVIALRQSYGLPG